MDKMRATLVSQIGELRAALGDSEVRRAELESVIAKARKHLDIVFGENSVHMATMRRILTISPSVVLENRDRENRAIGWDEGFTACAHEHMRQDHEPTHPITRINPYRGDNRMSTYPRGWHYGRSFGEGRWIEEACPCPKEPCGLVSRPSDVCDQHTAGSMKTIRQSHLPEDCPGVAPKGAPHV